MNHVKCVLSVIAGAAFGVAVAELLLGIGPRDTGICLAVIAACILGIYLIRAIQADHDEKICQTREDVWDRRDSDWIYSRPLYELPEFDEEKKL